MKIAVTSQNRKTITGHAGKCRKFWIYESEGATVKRKILLELPIEQSFHQSHGEGPHPLDDINVLISGGMGSGLQNRLKRNGILVVLTAETDPDRAVVDWLNGTLIEVAPEACDAHAHHFHPHH